MKKFQYETNHDSDYHHDNMQVSIWPQIIPNISFPISMSREKAQASKEEITACENFHPPSDSLPNEFLVIKNLGGEEVL